VAVQGRHGTSCAACCPATRAPRTLDVNFYPFALFNENQKPGPTSERNYGVFYPNQQKVYDVEFVLSSKGGNNGGLGWQDNSRSRAPEATHRQTAVGTTGKL
jgi:hypothetical protein